MTDKVIRINTSKIKNRTTFKIKTEYYFELLTPEKFVGSTNNKITKDKNNKDVPYLENIEEFLVAKKSFEQSLDISAAKFTFLKTIHSEK